MEKDLFERVMNMKEKAEEKGYENFGTYWSSRFYAVVHWVDEDIEKVIILASENATFKILPLGINTDKVGVDITAKGVIDPEKVYDYFFKLEEAQKCAFAYNDQIGRKNVKGMVY